MLSGPQGRSFFRRGSEEGDDILQDAQDLLPLLRGDLRQQRLTARVDGAVVRGGGRSVEAEQLPQREVQGTGDLVERVHRGTLQTALDVAEIGGVEVGAQGDGLLAEPALLPEQASLALRRSALASSFQDVFGPTEAAAPPL